MFGDETHECERCGEEFDAYAVLIRDDFNEVFEWHKRKEKYDHLCEECNDRYFKGRFPGFDRN